MEYHQSHIPMDLSNVMQSRPKGKRGKCGCLVGEIWCPLCHGLVWTMCNFIFIFKVHSIQPEVVVTSGWAFDQMYYFEGWLDLRGMIHLFFHGFVRGDAGTSTINTYFGSKFETTKEHIWDVEECCVCWCEILYIVHECVLQTFNYANSNDANNLLNVRIWVMGCGFPTLCWYPLACQVEYKTTTSHLETKFNNKIWG